MILELLGHDTRHYVGVLWSRASRCEVHELFRDAIHGQCLRYWDGDETSCELYFSLDQEKEAGASLVEAESSEAMQMFLYEGRKSDGTVNVGLVEGNLDSIFGFTEPGAKRVGSSDFGPCICSSNSKSESFLQTEPNPNCDDASFYNLFVPDDRCCRGEALQGWYVRSLGGMDGEREPEAWPDCSEQLQASFENRLHWLVSKSLGRTETFYTVTLGFLTKIYQN